MDKEKSIKRLKRLLMIVNLKKQASVELGLSIRQVNRLVKAYREGRKTASILHGDRRKTDK